MAKNPSMGLLCLLLHLGAKMVAKLFDESSLIAETKLTVLSNGLGQDSTTILLKLILEKDFREKYAPGELLVLFADTGNEHPFTYEYRDTVIIPLCKKNNIEFITISSDMGFRGKNWESLETQWKQGNPTIGSVAYPKTCSHRLKLGPQYNFCEDWISKKYNLPFGRKRGFTSFSTYNGKIKWLIGIARGEESRVVDADAETALWKRKSIQVSYPLIDEGMNRTDCQAYIQKIGYPLPMPSNCMFCPFSCNHMEILWLYKTYPDRFMDWCKHEQRKLDAHSHVEKNLGVSGRLHKDGENKGKAFTLLDVLQEAQEKYPDITLEELQAYKWSHGHNVQSKY